MTMVAWVRHFFALGAESNRAADELQRELSRARLVRDDMGKVVKDLQDAREAVQAKARAVLRSNPAIEGILNDERLETSRPTFKSSSG
jgi:hypothetical protein